MPQESFENFKKDSGESKKEVKNIKPADTIYSKPFNKKDKENETERLTLDRIKQNEERVEKIKERFNELMLLLSEGKLETPVTVAGENHWMELNRFLKGDQEASPQDLSRDVVDGFDPNKINIEFKLTRTENRPDPLFINIKVSAARLLEGGGVLKEDLERNITNIFGGTTQRYKNMSEAVKAEEDKEEHRERPPVDPIQKIAMERGLMETGAVVTRIEYGKIFTLIAEYPDTQKKVVVSVFGSKEPWRLEKITNKDDKVENFAGPPGEVLSEIYKFIETEK